MEREEIDAFINDQLAKGYIHPSTSDQTSGNASWLLTMMCTATKW